MSIENLTKEDIDTFSDEEIAFCYSQIKRQKEVEQMKEAILNYIELQNIDNVKTIKLIGSN